MGLPAFEVDKAGLGKLLARKGVHFAVLELVQNALDENVTRVHVSIEPVSGSRGYHTLIVTDDSPEGFTDISHAYTLFAESKKKGDPEKRGRFNLGEKLVIAVCRKAEIRTTSGTVKFQGNTRVRTGKKTTEGSVFTGEIKMTLEEAKDTRAAVESVIVPQDIELWLDGVMLTPRGYSKQIESCKLKTEIADDEGYLRPTQRNAQIDLYPKFDEDEGWLYELGIPVVEIGGMFDVDIRQKVPLNTDRDNVTPAYLRKVRTYVLNATADDLSKEEADQAWVNDALASPDVEADAVSDVLDQRYGKKRVIYDPSDREANQIAAAKGYTVIPGGSMTSEQWGSVRRTGAATAAGKVTPSPKPFSENGDPLKTIPRREWTPEMAMRVAFIERMGFLLLKRGVTVIFTKERGWKFAGAYGNSTMHVNISRLGDGWLTKPHSDQSVIDFIVHELAHEHGGHLDMKYHQALTRFAGQLVAKAIEKPGFFR